MLLTHFEVGLDRPLFLIAGPCVIESKLVVQEIAGTLKAITQSLGMPLIFKASFDKANRSSGASFRGPGLAEGLKTLQSVKQLFGLPVLTDVHEDTPIDEVAEVVDVLQTPAFLRRQTNFIRKVAAAGKPVNIKKGQFLSPWEMQQVVDKARSTGNDRILVCERGYSFGYNNLISDMRSLAILRATGCPVVFDATHSVQLPGGLGASSGGQREFVPVLARAAVAVGVAGVFMETHPKPEVALSDGPNAWPLKRMASLLSTLQELDRVSKARTRGNLVVSTPRSLRAAAPQATRAMRWLAALFAVLLLLLQYRVWLSPDGAREVLSLKSAVAEQQVENDRLLERNRQLGAEVRDLKQGYAALEERARTDLGMIAGNETFYQVVPPSSAPAALASAPPSGTPAPHAQRGAAARE